MRNVLMICNTPYQIFVAVWLKMTELRDVNADIVISNHMNESERIYNNIQKTDLFSHIYYAASRNMQYIGSRRDVLIYILCPDKQLKRYINLNKKYDAIYFANCDNFTKLVYHTITNGLNRKTKNKDIKAYMFEDGISTYSKLMEQYYESCKPVKFRKLPMYKPKVIYHNISGIYAFDPSSFMWQPDTEIRRLKKVEGNVGRFKNVMNTIFEYNSMPDKYDRKYIFMEESFYAEGYDVNDIEMVNKIAEIVGKDNMMVKIHPRNPENRFKELGYKTNVNTFVPWEVIQLNQIENEYVFFAISSASIINPIKVFGGKIKSYSLYNCLSNVPKILKGPLWEATEYTYKKYYPMIKIIDSISEENIK